jgi:hypothetical protein
MSVNRNVTVPVGSGDFEASAWVLEDTVVCGWARPVVRWHAVCMDKTIMRVRPEKDH